ncbi:MAG TPA: NADH-quinone oxidoreductase subunit A [Ktedonobacterales bacterium]|nr:NADH-quinone oxidoreductase subunit A [Ktedonobacterales bacterium]
MLVASLPPINGTSGTAFLEVSVANIGYLYAVLYFLVGCMLVMVGLTAARVVGRFTIKKHASRSKLTIYESGETPRGSAWVQYPLAFYVFALLFVAFDVDIVFLISWAVVFQKLSWFGFVEIIFFIVVLALGLVYAWRKGVIRWI